MTDTNGERAAAMLAAVSDQVVSPSDADPPKAMSGATPGVVKKGKGMPEDAAERAAKDDSERGASRGAAAAPSDVPSDVIPSDVLPSDVRPRDVPTEPVDVSAPIDVPTAPSEGLPSAATEGAHGEAPHYDGIERPTFEARMATGRAALSAAVSTAARSVQRTADDVASAQRTEDAAWRQTESDADLPELRARTEGGEPLFDLALRLDREADFHRTLAVRTLRPGSGRLLALLSGFVALAGGTMLALAAGVRAFFGASIGDASFAEAAALSLVLAVSAGVGLFMEGDQRRRAQAALARAELAERRLERIAAVLALKEHDPKRFGDALTRLEREPTR